MMSIKLKWRCGGCGKVHDDRSDARICCIRYAHVYEAYICPVCSDNHVTEQEAIDCCGFDPDAPPSPPSVEELEAAGQLRLVP
jgi:hypothetical protein